MKTLGRVGRAVVVGTLLLGAVRAGAHGGAGAGHGEPMSVRTLVPGGPAESAGLRVGDRLVRLDEKPIVTLGDLEQVLGRLEPARVVPIVVAREDGLVTLSVTLGARPDGKASLGVGLAAMGGREPSGPEAVEQGLSREGCLAWVDETYGLAESIRELGLDLREEHQALRACMARDVQRMRIPIPFGWCDNVFKIHCSGLDLLTEVGEAWIHRCERRLGERLGVDLRADASWTACETDGLFDAYTLNGRTSDEAACQAAYERCASGEAAAAGAAEGE